MLFSTDSVPASHQLVCIALGTNIGDRKAALDSAIESLKALSPDSPVIESTRIETEPVDCPPGSPPFLNSVALLQLRKDEWTSHQLLERLQAIEKATGRPELRERNAPRALDLDIIFFGTQIVHEPNLKVPHPRAASRGFVLEPLSQLLPNFVFPGEKRTIAELLKAVL